MHAVADGVQRASSVQEQLEHGHTWCEGGGGCGGATGRLCGKRALSWGGTGGARSPSDGRPWPTALPAAPRGRRRLRRARQPGRRGAQHGQQQAAGVPGARRRGLFRR